MTLYHDFIGHGKILFCKNKNAYVHKVHSPTPKKSKTKKQKKSNAENRQKELTAQPVSEGGRESVH